MNPLSRTDRPDRRPGEKTARADTIHNDPLPTLAVANLPFMPHTPRRLALGVFLGVAMAHASLLLTWAQHTPPQYALAPVRPLYASVIKSDREGPTHTSPKQTARLRHTEPAVSNTRPGTPTHETSAVTTPPGPAANDEAVIIPPRFDAAYLDNPPPRYPVLSRRHGEQGQVLVRVFVDAAGQPVRVALDRSSAYPRLDEAALEAVRRWRFAPARQGQQAVGAWAVVPIVFSLRN